MSFELTAVLACIATALLGYLITQPEELQEHRYLKIVLSLPLVVLISSLFTLELELFRGWMALWCVAILAFIWKSPLAHFGSLGFLRMLHGDMNRQTGVQADIAGARALYKDGDKDDALKHLEEELEKEPQHYEGLLLLADWYLEFYGPTRALEPIDRLLAVGSIMGERRQHLVARRKQLEQLALVESLNSNK